MSAIRHHPPDETLAAFAAGALTEGEALVVATHLEPCADCRNWVGTLEVIGGVLLHDCPPLALKPDALKTVLARLTEAPPEPGVTSVPAPSIAASEMPDLPGLLRGYPLGPWETAKPGMEARRILISGADGAQVMLLNLAPGAPVGQHGHDGNEWVCVLSGAYHDEFGRYAAGDFSAADGDIVHTPVADAHDGCLCVVAVGRSA